MFSSIFIFHLLFSSSPLFSSLLFSSLLFSFLSSFFFNPLFIEYSIPLSLHILQRTLSFLEKLSPDLYEESKRSKIWRTYRWEEMSEMQVRFFFLKFEILYDYFVFDCILIILEHLQSNKGY